MIEEKSDKLISQTIKLRYRLFPWLPVIINYKKLRMLEVIFGDCLVRSVSLTKLHRFSVLERIYRDKWYQCKYVGFQVWYCFNKGEKHG